jgi:hypothetical protein
MTQHVDSNQNFFTLYFVLQFVRFDFFFVENLFTFYIIFVNKYY